MGAAVRTRASLVVSFISVLLLSLLALIAAFILGWAGKDSVIPFLIICGFLATIGSVIGTTGRLSLSELATFIRCLRRPR